MSIELRVGGYYLTRDRQHVVGPMGNSGALFIADIGIGTCGWQLCGFVLIHHSQHHHDLISECDPQGNPIPQPLHGAFASREIPPPDDPQPKAGGMGDVCGLLRELIDTITPSPESVAANDEAMQTRLALARSQEARFAAQWAFLKEANNTTHDLLREIRDSLKPTAPSDAATGGRKYFIVVDGRGFMYAFRDTLTEAETMLGYARNNGKTPPYRLATLREVTP